LDQHNVRTLAAYEARVPQYLASTPLVLPPVLVAWLETVLAPYPRAHVLEIGSGPGKIAEHLIECGHRVTLTDATAAFVEHLRKGEGEEWSTAKLGVARYFCYWQPEPLHDLVIAAGFASVQVTHWATRSGQPFLAVIADAGRSG
jgi:hypothetical protein